jgi:hypothetical protein
MTLIKAKVVDSMHLELESGIETSDKEVFVEIVRRGGIVESVKGAWGYDVDSKDFVRDLRKSRRLNWI